MKMGRFALWIAVMMAVTLFVLASGCGTPASKEEKKTVNVSASVGVQVLDVMNNTAVNGARVYFASCSPNGTSDRAFQASGITGDDGWALFTVNYTLSEGEAIYLGASDIEPLVNADLEAGAFNGSGNIGEWKLFNYSLLFSGENDKEATIGCAITVDRDTGKMI